MRRTAHPRPIRSDQRDRRRGAAIVEFAVIAPLFITLALGAFELGQAYKTSQIMTASVREAGRLVGMDWEGVVPAGSTANQKVINDVRNFITASGLPGDAATITITSADGDDAGDPMDISDPDNEMRLARLKVDLVYSNVSEYPATFMQGRTLSSSLVIRIGRGKLSD